MPNIGHHSLIKEYLYADRCLNFIYKAFNISCNGKKYTDAGFKDAVIYETIVEYISSNDTIGILFTQDKDYGVAVDTFKLISVKHDNKEKAFEEFKQIIKTHFNILEQDDFEAKLKSCAEKSVSEDD